MRCTGNKGGSTRAALFRHDEENVPFWDEEHNQIGMNDSAMHLIHNLRLVSNV